MQTKLSTCLQLLLVLALALAAHPVRAELPNTLTAGQPARAAEVMANFNDLDGRITANDAEVGNLRERIGNLETSTANLVVAPNFSGYFAGFPDQANTSNVLVFRQLTADNLLTAYTARVFTRNTTEQFLVDGANQVREFVASYITVRLDAGGNITSVSRSVESPDTPAYLDWYAVGMSYDASLNPIVDTASLQRVSVSNNGGRVVTNLELRTPTSDNTQPDRIRAYTSRNLLRDLLDSIQVNGMTFDDVQVENYLVAANGTVRYRARGIGEVLRLINGGNTIREILYYNSNGQTGGSLAGTPFAAGGPLNGVFFSDN